MAAKRQKLKLSKRSVISESNDSKVDNSPLINEKTFSELSCNNDGESSFSSNGDIFKKLRQQLENIHTESQSLHFTTFPDFKVNKMKCNDKEALDNSTDKWTPFPDFCSQCATGLHSDITGQLNKDYSGMKSSPQNEACVFSKLISHFHKENLNGNQLNWIGKISNLNPATPQQNNSEKNKSDCMLSPDLFACQSSVERRTNIQRETNDKSVAKNLFLSPNIQQNTSIDRHQQGEVSHGQSVTSLIKQCPICEEVFTPWMELRERNIHIESCLDVTSSDILCETDD